MLSETEAVYELWEEEPLIFLPHSRLYSLEPIGVGSLMVESLTSYITRLADAHCLYPRQLLMGAKPLAEISFLYVNGHAQYDRLTTYWKASFLLNGMGVWARNLVQALEQVTLRQHLRSLTMLLWKDIFSSRKLLRTTRAWCPICYAERREAHQEVYDPLLWALEIVSRCTKHDVPLQHSCPNVECARSQYLLAPRSRPGYCAWCNCWLGVSFQEGCLEPEEEMRERQQWIHDHIGALLSCGPSFPPAVYRCHIAETLTAYEKVLTGGSGHAFAKYLSIDPTTLQRYKRGELVPQLSTVVHLCGRLRISPTELLNGTSMEVLSEQCLHTPGIPALSKPKSSLKKFDHQKVLPALEAALQSTIEPPPSMREVARQVGYDVGHIMHYYRSHCHKIAQRYLAYRSMKHEQRLESMKEEVRKVMLALHAQGHYPSSMRVRQFLSYPHAFKDPQVYAVWKSIMQELGLRN